MSISQLVPRIRPVVAPPTRHLRALVRQAADGSFAATLGAYARLQPGRWWEWLSVWVLQAVRHCPVYVLPLITGNLIDRIDPRMPARVLDALPKALGGALVLALTTVVATFIAHVLLSRITRSLTATLRADVIQRINRASLAFHDQARAGELQNKFTMDMGRLEGLQVYLAETILMQGTVVVVVSAIMLAKNPLLFAVLLVAVPINLLVVRLAWKRMQHENEAYRSAETGFLADLIEALQGVRITRAHAIEGFVNERVARSAGTVAQRAMRLDVLNNLFGTMSWSISNLVNMAVMGFGIWLCVMQPVDLSIAGMRLALHPISLGDFTVLICYHGILSGAIGGILGGMPAIAAAKDGIRSLGDLYQEGADRAPSGGARPERIRGAVAFQDVVFRYPGASEHCLRGIDLQVEPGTSLALVGPSGSGKSTIASLLLGFYRPDAGRISIDGRSLGDLHLPTLRSQVGVVSQDVHLFRASILDNIGWGDPKPDRERARRAADMAHATEFIAALPGGLDHELADRGGGLSGGQRQRLAIARALYRDPRLLILDEATSALDAASERQVQAALEQIMRDRTTLIIAHRLSTVKRADRIAVLVAGRVAELGSYEELMARDGTFRRLAMQDLQ